MSTHKSLMKAAALVMAVAIVAPTVGAQSQSMRATVPFDFYVADRLLPAGTYIVEPQANTNAIRVYDDRGNSTFVMLSSARENRAVDYSRLVFRRYGDSAFLSAVYWSGFTTGRTLPSSRTEKRIAQNGPPALQVAVQMK